MRPRTCPLWASVGFQSLEDPAGNIYQAPPNMNVIQELSLRPPDEGSIHPIPGRRAADFPEGQAHFPAAINIDAWSVLPETHEPTECSFLPAPLAPEGPAAALQGAYIGLPIRFNTFSGERTQTVQAQMPCTADSIPRMTSRTCSYELSISKDTLRMPSAAPVVRIGTAAGSLMWLAIRQVPILSTLARIPRSSQ